MKSYERDIVLRVVKANMSRQKKEENAINERVKELSGIGGDDTQEEDPKEKAILDALMPEIAETMTDMMLSEKPLSASLDIAVDEIINSVARASAFAGEEIDSEDLAIARPIVKSLASALFEVFLSDTDSPILDQLRIDEILEISDKHGVAIEEVIAQDDLYRELVRMTVTEEEFREGFNKVLELYDNPEQLLSMLVEPIVASMVAQEEAMFGEKFTDDEISEIRKEFFEELSSDPEIVERFAVLRTVTETVIAERAREYFGAPE